MAKAFVSLGDLAEKKITFDTLGTGPIACPPRARYVLGRAAILAPASLRICGEKMRIVPSSLVAT